MRVFNRGGIAAAAVVLALTSGGCVERSVEGDGATYSFSWWVPALVLLSAVVALPAAFLLRKRSNRLAWVLMVMSPVLGVLVFPSLILDRVKVDSQHFEARYGLWFTPTSRDVRFCDVRQMRVVTYETRGRRGRKTTKQKMVCATPSGSVTVQMGDLVRRAAPEILDRAKALGIPVTAVRE